MNDDNGIVNTNQSQLNPATDNHLANPTFTAVSTPLDSGFSAQPPQNVTSINQSNQLSPATIPEPPIMNNQQVTSSDDDSLEEIKRTALQNLLPIVSKLDQGPEERFQTLLMVIQASDNRELINEAYATAAKIPDDGERAKALLAIINEINYFTQQPPQTN